MTSPFLGEFLGTMVMIFMGNGVVAGVLLKRSKAEGAGWMAITAGWAFAVVAGVFTAIACGSKAAYLNPAVALGFAVSSGNYAHLGLNIAAQILGGFAGAVLVWIHFGPHWKETSEASHKLAAFCSVPAIRNVVWNFVSEVIATLILVFVIAAIFSKHVAAEGPAAGLGPFLVGALVWGIGLSLGGKTGYAINPARDLGPRVAHALLPIPGKGASDWGYAPIPIFAPLVGGGIAGLLIRWIGF